MRNNPLNNITFFKHNNNNLFLNHKLKQLHKMIFQSKYDNFYIFRRRSPRLTGKKRLNYAE